MLSKKRGSKGIEGHLPNIFVDINSFVDFESQTYPRFEDNRLFKRLTPESIKTQLHKKGYKIVELPANHSIYIGKY